MRKERRDTKIFLFLFDSILILTNKFALVIEFTNFFICENNTFLCYLELDSQADFGNFSPYRKFEDFYRLKCNVECNFFS